MIPRSGQRGRAAVVVASAFAVLLIASGPRWFSGYRELRCPDGEGAQPVSIAPVYQCTAIPAGVNAWPNSVVLEDRSAFYLANVRIRVFDIDRAWGTYLFLAWDVPVVGDY